MNVDQLEPAERNPAQLRRTALILLGIIIFSGFFVTYAYKQLLERQQNEFRPEYKQRLTGNFGVVLQDGTQAALYDLEGKVWFAAMIDFRHLENDFGVLEGLKNLSEAFADRDDIHFVLFPVDPSKQRPEEFQELAKERGWDQSRWWIAGAGNEFLHKFLKNRMKMGIYPHEKDGKWIYDRSIVVIDRNMHLRGHYDFESAQKRDAAQKKGDVEVLEDESWTLKLRSHLKKTVEYLLSNER